MEKNISMPETNSQADIQSQKRWLDKFSLKELISFLALIVSILSLLYTWSTYEKVIQPHLYCEVGDTKSSTSLFGLYIRNNGRGTAIVTTINILLDSTKISDLKNLRRILNKYRCPNTPIDAPTSQPLFDKMEIAPGEEITVYAVTKSSTNVSQVDTLFEHLSIRLKYSSLGRKKKYLLEYP